MVTPETKHQSDQPNCRSLPLRSQE